ncbi:MAG: phosphoribosylaminoimidazolecarboxamide formyltransferase [Myxococcales bacterium]|nr:phosphoribosylaminoimidazolecarboxamide formyltransferase [Myxococcales bacterium]MDD9970391.1 phosphoribosylaminoimidazolecarboxamide formyltransferase [Myxococcales bacterium]
MQLKYGCNPHQTFAEIVPLVAGTSPIELLNGKPSFINYLDAINGFQLVRELRAALELPAAASFKHVSPAGAAVAVPLSDDRVRSYEVTGKELTPAALAYVRARGADPKSSFGDFVALSEPVDEATARLLRPLVSDGIIAPAYEPAALAILKAKKKGGFIVLKGDPDFSPPARESREMFGMRLTQDRNSEPVHGAHLSNVVCGQLTSAARRDMLLGLIALKYTQSNSVGYALDGQMIGIGAGQQSRVDCTKLAGSKADVWHLMRHPKVLALPFKESVKRQDRINLRVRYIEGDLLPSEQETLQEAITGSLAPLTPHDKTDFIASELDGVTLASDAFFPFRDNIDHASRHGVKYIVQPGGSVRDDDVTAACREYGMTMVHTGLRLFHH